MELVDIEPGDQRLATDILPVLRELRPRLTAESFDAIYREGHPQGLRYTAGYEDGRCVAVAGWRVIATTFAGRKLYVDDLVTSSEERSHGYGGILLREVRRRAVDAGCTVFDLDSGVHREGAHRFYFREGMHISAFHFTERLVEPPPDG